MEVEAEPTVAQSGLETPPANPGSPEYSPGLAAEASQTKQESTGLLPILDEAAHCNVEAGKAGATGVPPSFGGKACLPVFQQRPAQLHPCFKHQMH